MIGFDSKKYIELEVNVINERANKFDRVYLEVGGHILKDYHASRVLPGYHKDNKMKILEKIKDNSEVIYCIYYKYLFSAIKDYNSNKEMQNLFLEEIKELRKRGFKIAGVMITRVENQNKIKAFKKLLEKEGFKVYEGTPIKNYPEDLKEILGKDGYNKQPYIKLERKIIIVTGAFSNAGKMGVCLSQVFLDTKHNINSGYFKFETFPIWNLPLKHPVNVAYEAATADIQDINMVDPYHKRAYGISAINYNRDIENYKILSKLISKIVSKNNSMRNYKSPTDMGINIVKKAITNDKVIREAGIKEVKTRYKKYLKRYKQGKESIKTIERMKEILENLQK
ncbi:MAG: DUF1846 domain-containing protein [archaeon]